MLGEINKDFYCSADSLNGSKRCSIKQMVTNDNHCSSLCKNYHRKYPTPEQYKEEYGEEYPDDGAVYIGVDREDFIEILTVELQQLQGKTEWRYTFGIGNRTYPIIYTVCACTPFGKPDDNWRPKE